MVQENLDTQDIDLLEEKQISYEDLATQLENFEKGFPAVSLVKPATINDGIRQLSQSEISQYIDFYESKKKEYHTSKFVPASGAATRMFKALFNFSKGDLSNKTEILELLRSIDYFSFAQEVISFSESNNINIKTSEDNDELKKIVDYIIGIDGLNYGGLPKGMIPFHCYGDFNRTAFEEHLVEGALYSRDSDEKVKLHFTVAPQHQKKIDKLIKKSLPRFEKKYGVTYVVEYSVQESSTDTVAVDLDNIPFRQKDGTLLFRPGGHGALLKNLNELSSDIVFIKNIDNVVHDRLKKETLTYKKALAGLLIEIRSKTDNYLSKIEKNKLTETEFEEGVAFAKSIGIELKGISPEELYDELNRPIRVCGMVKNEGEPGGGPFWVEDKPGHTSLQIVEGSQIDKSNSLQRDIFNHSTHFNPVDLVCSITDYKGRPFDLFQFRDSNTGFITLKSVEGKEIKAQELPGLWNGAMANWITVFVEVPLITFNPVKTLKDLLRDAHQKS